MASSPPSQRIASVKVLTENLTEELEVLLDLVCECLRKASIAGYEIGLLRGAVHCRG